MHTKNIQQQYQQSHAMNYYLHTKIALIQRLLA